jgi:TRAP-type C4-dicarboxylate transport system substrate-binding protein
MKLSRRLFIAAAVAATMASAPATAQIKWDLAHVFGPTDQAGVAAEYFAKLVKEKTKGQIEVTIHHAGALGYKCLDHLDLVADGGLVIASICTAFHSGVHPIFSINTMPFLVQKPEDAKHFHASVQRAYNEVYRSFNQFELYSSPNPPSGLWAKRPILSAADLKNWKLRVYDVNGLKTFIRAGAAAIQLAWSDVVPALSTSTIDGVLTGADAGFASGFQDYLNHFIYVNFAIPWGTTNINFDTWNALSPELQKAVKEAGDETTAMSWKRMETILIEKNNADMRSAGVTVIEDPPKAFLDFLQEAGKPALDELLEKLGPDGPAMLDDFYRRIGKKK